MTIKDLARLSGYSLGTVSRALNHQPDVSPKARDRILSLALQYGYEINANAQSLKQQNSNALLVIVKGRANVLFSRLVEETQTLASSFDQPILVDYIDEDDNEVRRAIQLCREKKPRGILFFGGTQQNFQADFDKISVPSVLMTNFVGTSWMSLSSVTTDDAAGAFTATDFLIRCGHRQIAIIGGDPEKSEISQKRLSGCMKAFQSSDARMCRYAATRFSFEGGYQAMEQILADQESGVTGVFAMSDVMAIGAMRCIHDRGLKVPEDISVIGYDGLPIGRYYTPKLTTVVQSIEDLARTGYEVLQDALSGKGTAHITVPYFLSEGESVRSLI